MTLHTDGRDRQIECDRCPDSTAVYDKDDFEVMVAVAKEEGWEIRQSASGWEHLCRTCRGQSRLERAKSLLG